MNFDSLARFGRRFAAGTALLAAVGAAQALPIVDGFTAVRLTSAPTLTGAGVSVAPLGTATASPGDDGIPVAYFPITGGNINTATFAGTIEHEGSGLRLSTASGSLQARNFLINTTSLTLFGDVTFGSTTLADVPLFNIGLTGSPAYPFSLTLTATAGAALAQVLGVPNLTGAVIGVASTTPVTAVPEPSAYALMLAGLAAVGFLARRRGASVKLQTLPV